MKKERHETETGKKGNCEENDKTNINKVTRRTKSEIQQKKRIKTRKGEK